MCSHAHRASCYNSSPSFWPRSCNMEFFPITNIFPESQSDLFAIYWEHFQVFQLGREGKQYRLFCYCKTFYFTRRCCFKRFSTDCFKCFKVNQECCFFVIFFSSNCFIYIFFFYCQIKANDKTFFFLMMNFLNILWGTQRTNKKKMF